jgi:hypothetical protein
MRLAVFLLCIWILSSCAKSGCTDANADNFSEQAEKNDGTCHYSADVKVYWLKDFSDDMRHDSIRQFKMFVNGKYVATCESDFYWSQKPDLTSSTVYSYRTDYTPGTEKTVFITLFDESGWLFKKAYYTIKYPGQNHYKLLESKLE